uniref:Uncharacterized protein n=1 Tax=Aegilops tauschii subsp. strangulata TaxID=200361 RepID=A0A453RU43_AEGTS
MVCASGLLARVDIRSRKWAGPQWGKLEERGYTWRRRCCSGGSIPSAVSPGTAERSCSAAGRGSIVSFLRSAIHHSAATHMNKPVRACSSKRSYPVAG